jgi:hypothetical protein
VKITGIRDLPSTRLPDLAYKRGRSVCGRKTARLATHPCNQRFKEPALEPTAGCKCKYLR